MPCTVCFTFDNMGEAADIGAGRLNGPLPVGSEPSLATGSRGPIGPRKR